MCLLGKFLCYLLMQFNFINVINLHILTHFDRFVSNKFIIVVVVA